MKPDRAAMKAAYEICQPTDLDRMQSEFMAEIISRAYAPLVEAAELVLATIDCAISMDRHNLEAVALRSALEAVRGRK